LISPQNIEDDIKPPIQLVGGIAWCNAGAIGVERMEIILLMDRLLITL
jgi:hypothetical protein